MKFKLILLTTTLLGSSLTFAQSGPPEGNTLNGDIYGEQLTLKAESKAITVDQLNKDLIKNNKKVKNVIIRGKVTDVCDKKGCWLTIQTEDHSKFFVKMKDYAFFVPTALKGKNVLLEGDAEIKTVSVNEQKHYAEDAKKPQSEIDAITQPKEEIRFVATGIKVVQ